MGATPPPVGWGAKSKLVTKLPSVTITHTQSFLLFFLFVRENLLYPPPVAGEREEPNICIECIDRPTYDEYIIICLNFKVFNLQNRTAFHYKKGSLIIKEGMSGGDKINPLLLLYDNILLHVILTTGTGYYPDLTDTHEADF